MTEAGESGPRRGSGERPGTEGQDFELVTYGLREGAAQAHVERFSTLVERDDMDRYGRRETTMPEIPAAQRPRMEPAHPGAILREDVLPALGLTGSEAARQLRVSRQMLHSILCERSPISPEMAVRLGRFCGNGSVLWLRMQTDHDLWHAERKLHDEVEHIPKPGPV